VDTWYHTAVTYDGTNVTLYLNGQPDGFRAADLNTVLDPSGLAIGTRPGSSYWQGQLDEVMLFNRALSAGEIAAIHAAGAAGVCRPVTAVNLAGDWVGGQLRLSWPSQAGARYQVQSATSLPAAGWQNEGFPLFGTGGVLFKDVPSGPDPARFFRLQIGN
jgi:hypothetical protein